VAPGNVFSIYGSTTLPSRRPATVVGELTVVADARPDGRRQDHLQLRPVLVETKVELR